MIIRILALITATVVQYVKSNTVTYNNGGSDWGSQCTGGSFTRQSPIDIEDIKGACDNTIMLDLTLFFKNITTTFTHNMDEGVVTATFESSFGTMYATGLNGKIYGYDASRIVWHAPSEHSIEGVKYDAEMQIEMDMKSEFEVERNKAILTLLFTNTEQAAPSGFIKLFMEEGEQMVNFNASLSFILPTPLVYFAYEGSLTQPPCSETVNWYVIEKAIPISTSQLAFFNDLWKGNEKFANFRGNDRDIQNLNGRVIKKGGVECEEQFIYFFSFVLLYAFINYFIFKLL